MEEDAGLKRKHARLAKDQQLDSALHQWFVQARAEGVPISVAIVQAQAEKFDKNLKGEDSSFKANTGRLDRFKKRHGISKSACQGRYSQQIQRRHILISFKRSSMKVATP